MNCKNVRTQIALSVGGDLDDAQWQSVREHVEACPKCRRFCRELQSSMRLLRYCRSETASIAQPELWPSVWQRIRLRREANATAEFNGWVAGLAVAAICLAVAVLVSSDVAPREDDSRIILVEPPGTTFDNSLLLDDMIGGRLHLLESPSDEGSIADNQREVDFHRRRRLSVDGWLRMKNGD